MIEVNSKLLIVSILTVFLTGCGTLTKPVPSTQIIFQTRDSVAVRDSIVITPVERVVDIVPDYDTLQMETSLAKAKAWVDTSLHMLRGEIENKQEKQKEIREKIKYQTRDSLVYKEVPVEVEKIKIKHPRYEPWLWAWGVLSLVLVGLFLRKRFTLKH